MPSTQTYEEELTTTEPDTQVPAQRETEAEFEYEPTIVRGRE